MDKISKYSDEKYSPIDINIDDLVQKYTKYLNDIIGKNDKMILYPYPQTNHSEIAHKAIYKLKPFKKNGDGYRDTLIWESIKEILINDSDIEIYYISNNTSDFSQEKKGNKLHYELLKDLENNNIDKSRVSIYDEIKKFYVEVINKELESLEKLREYLEKDKYDLLTHEMISEAISDKLTNSFITYNLPDNDQPDAWLVWIYDIEVEDVSQIKKIIDNELYISLDFSADADFEYFVYKPDYFANDSPDYIVDDLDWNDHYAKVLLNTRVNFNLEIIFNTDDETIEVMEFIPC